MRQAMEPVGLGSAEMWNNPEDGRWIYTKTMRVASFMWQIWKRGVLGLLLLSSLPILLPVLLLAFGVGFIFLLPFLPGVAAYFVLSRRFPALRISGWYRYLTSYTPGLITSADTGVPEEERSIVYEDDNIQSEESQETSDDVSQAIEEETVSDTWSKPHVEGGEGNVFQEVSELSRDPSFRPSPVEGVANVVQEGEEQSFSPEQHDIRSIEEEAGEGMDHEMGPDIQGLHPVEVLSSENGTDVSSPQEYAAADVSSEPSMPVEDFQRPFGGHEAIEEEGKENADPSLPVDDVGDELASSEGDQGDEGKVLPQEESSAKADLPSQFEQLLPLGQQQEELDGKDVDGEEEQKVLTEESLAEPVPASDIFPPLEELSPSRQHEEGLDGMHANQEEEKEVVTGEESPVEAVPGFDPPLSSEQLLPSRPQQEELDDKDVDEEEEKKVLTGEASPAEEAALDSDIPSPPEESLSSRHDRPEELDGKDVDEEGEKALIGDASPSEAVSGSDLPTPSKQSLLSRQHQEAVDGIVADEEEEEKVLTGEESLGEEVSRTDLPTEKLLQQEEIDGKDADKMEEKDITGEESVAEAALDSLIPFPSEESLPPGQHQDAEELDGKDTDEEEEKKVLREEESPAEAVSPFDVVSEPLPSKSEDGEAGQVTEEQKSIGEREPSAEESRNFESPSEYDSTQEEEEGGRLEETVATNLPADHSLARGESHKQTGGDAAVEEEAAQDIFNDFESEIESEEDYFLSPGVSISEGFSEEELGLTEPAHLQPPGGQDEQVPDMEAEPEGKEEGKYFAQASSAAETTSEELASANHGQSEDNVLDKEEGVEESTVADSASEKPWPAGVHNEIDISKPDEEEDKMAFKQQPANQELAGPDSKHPEEDQKQLDINVATEKDELDNLKGNESKSENEDISSSNVPPEELMKDGDIGFASEHLSLSGNDDKELIKNEPSQEESQEDNIEAKDSAGYNFGTGEEENNKEVTDINGEGELAEKNVHVEEPKSTNDISLNLNAEHPTTFPVSEQTSDSGPTPEYPRECDKKHESGGFPEDAQKDTQPEVVQEPVTPEEEESNTAHFMEQQDDKSPSPNPPDIVEETREESTPGVGSDSSGLAKESHLQSGYLPELEIDDGESLNETEIPGGMLLPKQEQRQNVKSSSESTSNMPEEPSSPSKTTTSRDRGFAEGQQPGPLSPQLAPNSTVTEGDSSQDSPSQESSHVAHSLRLEDKTLDESTEADQHEVHVKERNQEAEKVPSSQGSNVAGDMEVLSDDENEEESNPFGKPTSLPQRRLSFSEAGDEVAAANLGVPFSEEHNKDRQPDHEELSINTLEYVWPSEAEEHGLNGTPRGETEYEGSVADNSTRTTRSEEPTPAQKPGSSDPVSEHPTLLLPDRPDRLEDWPISCRKRREDESRPDGVSPTEPSLESPASEANTATSTPPFEFFTPSPSQQQKSRTGGRRLSFSKHNRSMNRRSAPELVRTQTWAADSATSPPHDASREFKKAKYMDRPDVKEPTTRTSSASRAQGAEAFEGEFEGLLQYWKERDKATKSPDVSPKCTPLIPSVEVVRQVREEISTIKRIIGQDIPPQDSLWEDVETLSQIVGIQLPNMGDVSDLAKARQGLELLKVVVGVRWDEHVT